MAGKRLRQWHARVPRAKIADADSILRKWAVAHAGPYASQARRKIRRGMNDSWQKDDVEIAIRSLSNTLIPHLQVVQATIRRERDNWEARYKGHAITWQTSEYPEEADVICSLLDDLPDEEERWETEAGYAGLDQAVAALLALDGTLPPGTGPVTLSGRQATNVDALRPLGTMAVLLPWGDEDQPCQEMANAVMMAGPNLRHAVLDHGAVRALGRTLDDAEAMARLNRATMAIYERPSTREMGTITFTTEHAEEAAEAIREAVTRERSAQLQSGTHRLCEMMLGLAAMAGDSEVRMQVREPITNPAAADEEPPATTRTETLSDQVSDLRLELAIAREENERQAAELRAAYESLGRGGATDGETLGAEEDDEPHRNRRAQVEEWISEGRFDGVRFLRNATRPMSKVRHERPEAGDIGEALDRINGLGHAWANTPTRNIGNWKNYFNGLTGWHYSPSESEQTATRHNAERQFKDDETDRLLAIYRHVTYHSHGASFQIFFDSDGDEIIVAYMGPHLPYATEI